MTLSVHQKCPLAIELPYIAAPLLPFLALGLGLDSSSSQDPLAAQSLHRADIQTSVTQDVQLDADSAAALALPPVLMPRHRTYQLTEKGILEMTGVSLLGMLTHLNLHGSALKRIEVKLHSGITYSANFTSHAQLVSMPSQFSRMQNVVLQLADVVSPARPVHM